MKHSFIKLLLTALLILPTIAKAYTYTFHNKTNTDLIVGMQLAGGIGEKIEGFWVPANGTSSRTFGGLRSLLCMSTSSRTLQAIKWPHGPSVYPLIISRRSRAYQELLRTGSITSVDFGLETPCTNFRGTADAALKCNPPKVLCLDLDIDIHETTDNHLVFVFQ